MDENNIDNFNMICGGSPCQDFSVAGKQKGSVWTCKECNHTYNPLTVHWIHRNMCPKCGSTEIDKTRSSLLVEYLRMIRANKPNFGIYENVKNIVGKQFKDTFNMFVQELEEYGYNVYWKVLNAKNFGIPQNRERVYVVFIKKDLDNGKFKYPEPFDNGVRLKDFLEDYVDEKFYISEERMKIIRENLGNVFDRSLDSGSTSAIMESGGGQTLMIKQVCNIVNSSGQFENPQRGRIYSVDGVFSPALNCCGGGGLEPKILTTGLISNQGTKIEKETDTANTLLARDYNGFGNQEMNCVIECGGKVAIKQATKIGYSECKIGGVADLSCPNSKTRRGRVQAEGELCQAITTHENGICRIERKFDSQNDEILKQNSGIRIRKLTSKECFRLMGFTDNDYNAASAVVSNSQLYKQAGNSIVVDVLYYILIELYNATPYLFDDIKLGSFFSGIGAFESALDRLYNGINSGNFTEPQIG